MSEMDATTQAPGGATAGMLLRQAREAAGLHVSTLAANLKVPVRKLEALEEDRHDLLPDAVFARALAASVCRTLRIDPQPVMQRLPQTPHPRLAQDDGINAPFRPAGAAPRSGVFGQVSRPVALTVGVLLLAALVVTFLPERELRFLQGDRTDPAMPPGSAGQVTAPAEPRSEVSTVVVPAPVTAGAPVPAASAPAAVPALPAASAPFAAPAPALAASAAVAAALPASAAAATGAGVVVFRTTSGSSWISVTDARGTSVLRRVLAPGETADVTGALPLSVTVGNMQATEVQVRGQPFNMAPVSRDNVARFEVK